MQIIFSHTLKSQLVFELILQRIAANDHIFHFCCILYEILSIIKQKYTLVCFSLLTTASLYVVAFISLLCVDVPNFFWVSGTGCRVFVTFRLLRIFNGGDILFLRVFCARTERFNFSEWCNDFVQTYTRISYFVFRILCFVFVIYTIYDTFIFCCSFSLYVCDFHMREFQLELLKFQFKKFVFNYS